MKSILIILLISSKIVAQNSIKDFSFIQKKADSLISNTIGEKIFQKHFVPSSNINQIDKSISYSIVINERFHKEFKVFYDNSEKLRTTKGLLKRSLKEFINIHKLKPKITIDSAFEISQKSCLSKVDSFKLSDFQDSLTWILYDTQKDLSDVIVIDAKTGKVIDCYTITEF